MIKSSLLILLMIMMSCSPPNETTKEESIFVPETKQIETEVMSLINESRIDEGLNSLLPNRDVKAEAYTHTIYMIDAGRVSHDNFLARRASLIEIGATRVGENVAFGYTNAESVVIAWLNNEGHRDVTLGDYTHFEVVIEEDAEGNKYFTNIYIKL